MEALRCRGCGAESPTGIGWQRRGSAHLCSVCADRTSRRSRSSTLLTVVFVVMVGLLAAIAGWRVAVGAVVPYLVFVAGDVVATVFHELGHAVMAGLVGVKVYGIEIGSGGWFARFRVAGVEIRIGAVLAGGRTRIDPGDDRPGYRSRRIAILLAGPAAHLASIAVMWPWVAHAELLAWPRVWLYGASFGLVMQLLPLRLPQGETDGRQALRLLLTPDAALEAALPTATISSVVLENQQVINSASDRQALLEVRAALEKHLASDPPAAAAALSKNNLACVLLGLGEPEDLIEADVLSAEALQMAPDVSAVRSTRGAALVGVGKDAEALPLLRATVGDDRDGFTAGFLALAAIRRGRLDIARDAAAAATRFGFEGWPLRQATPLIGRAELDVLIENFGCGNRPVVDVASDLRRTAGPLAASMISSARSWLENARPADIDHLASSGVDVEGVRSCLVAIARPGR